MVHKGHKWFRVFIFICVTLSRDIEWPCQTPREDGREGPKGGPTVKGHRQERNQKAPDPATKHSHPAPSDPPELRRTSSSPGMRSVILTILCIWKHVVLDICGGMWVVMVKSIWGVQWTWMQFKLRVQVWTAHRQDPELIDSSPLGTRGPKAHTHPCPHHTDSSSRRLPDHPGTQSPPLSTQDPEGRGYSYPHPQYNSTDQNQRDRNSANCFSEETYTVSKLTG